MRRTLLRIAVLSCLFLGTGCCVIHVPNPLTGRTLEESMLFHPTPFPGGNWQPEEQLFTDAWFDSADGCQLHGWFAEASQPTAVILCCHGNAGNVTHRRMVLDMFRNGLNCSILVFDYRGYGKSTGQPREAGILADARAARAWLARKAGVNEKDIVLLGTSLGGGVAADLAAKDGARGLILENTFTSIPDVAGHHFPVLPTSWLMRTQLDSARSIADYQGPLLQVHGDRDRVVPYELGQRLFAAAREPKTFVTIPGGDHNDPPTPQYFEALKTFLRKLP